MFLGTGKEMLIQVQKYFNTKIGLVYGFSLQALPQARVFYENIGMVNLIEHDKDPLSYYEISQENAKQLLEEHTNG
jgi:hypothetical protein